MIAFQRLRACTRANVQAQLWDELWGLGSRQSVLRGAGGLHTFALSHVEEDVVNIE